jgi:hypothetical protein
MVRQYDRVLLRFLGGAKQISFEEPSIRPPPLLSLSTSTSPQLSLSLSPASLPRSRSPSLPLSLPALDAAARPAPAQHDAAAGVAQRPQHWCALPPPSPPYSHFPLIPLPPSLPPSLRPSLPPNPRRRARMQVPRARTLLRPILAGPGTRRPRRSSGPPPPPPRAPAPQDGAIAPAFVGRCAADARAFVPASPRQRVRAAATQTRFRPAPPPRAAPAPHDTAASRGCPWLNLGGDSVGRYYCLECCSGWRPPKISFKEKLGIIGGP